MARRTVNLPTDRFLTFSAPAPPPLSDLRLQCNELMGIKTRWTRAPLCWILPLFEKPETLRGGWKWFEFLRFITYNLYIFVCNSSFEMKLRRNPCSRKKRKKKISLFVQDSQKKVNLKSELVSSPGHLHPKWRGAGAKPIKIIQFRYHPPHRPTSRLN